MDCHLDQAVWAAGPTPEHCYDTLLVVGGLYGNPFAGETLRAMAAAERERLGEGSRVDCGCAYPRCIDDKSVARSNAIHRTMRDNVREHPELVALLEKRPGHMVAQVGECKVGITHGDEKMLGGWNCSLDDLRKPARQEELTEWMHGPNACLRAIG